MADFKVLKYIPLPVWWVFRPMLLLSIALHGIFLFFPMPSSDNHTKETEEVLIEITSLPESSTPSPANVSLNDQSISTEENLSAESDLDSPEPDTSPPSVLVSEYPASPSQNHAISPNNAPLDSATSPLDSQHPSSEPEPPINSPLPFSNFPHLSNAESGCFGLGNCHQIEGGNFRQAGANLVSQLEAQGYEVQQDDSLEDSGMKVYEVTKGETTQYLSLIQPRLGPAVYVLAAVPITESELLTAESLKAKFEDIVQRGLDGQEARYTDFSYPDFFFDDTTLFPEIGNALYTVQETNRLAVPLTNQLVTEGFAVESIGEYAGAPLYEVNQDAFVAYLSILPTNDNTGTIVVTWNSLPQRT